LTQEDRKKVVVFQQLKAQIDRLQEKRKTADLRLMAKIDEIIAKRSLEIDQCERELKEIEDGNGQNFLLLSADHGGGTLKLFLQNLTTAKPNSAANGYLVGEMDAPEKYENLKAAFGHYQEKIDNLNDHCITFTNDKGEIEKKTILIFSARITALLQKTTKLLELQE